MLQVFALDLSHFRDRLQNLCIEDIFSNFSLIVKLIRPCFSMFFGSVLLQNSASGDFILYSCNLQYAYSNCAGCIDIPTCIIVVGILYEMMIKNKVLGLIELPNFVFKKCFISFFVSISNIACAQTAHVMGVLL